jgi:hypothetical protein
MTINKLEQKNLFEWNTSKKFIKIYIFFKVSEFL